MEENIKDNIFYKIVNKQAPADYVYEDEYVVAINDINPQAPVHILVLPKTPLRGIADVSEEHVDIMGHMMVAVAKIARERSLEEDGYRVVINQGVQGGQTVFYLHIHILAGRQMGWPPG